MRSLTIKTLIQAWGLLMMSLTFAFSQDTAQLVLTLRDSSLIPEGIAYYAAGDQFFISSIRHKKIIAVDAQSGTTEDFISPEQNGFQGGVGLHVDEKDDLLYALCYSQVDSQYITGLFIYDLTTGALILRVKEDGVTKKLLNDLVVDKKGNVFVTDTYRNCIWMLPQGEQKFESFYSEENLSPNGIAIADDGKTLFVATWEKGILALNISTQEIQSIHADGEIRSQGIDGLYYYKGSLIAVHNKNYDHIVRYHLEDDRVCTHWEIVDPGNKYFQLPTTGVLHKDRFYCLANSQIDKLDQEKNKIKSGEKLNPVYILSYDLKTKKNNRRKNK